MGKGDVIGGLGQFQHALDLKLSENKLDEKILSEVKYIMIGYADKYPIESHKIYQFIQSNGMELNCDERNTIYASIIRDAYSFAQKSRMDEIRECLFLAPYWAGECAVDEKNLSKYRKLFKAYKSEKGEAFIEADWMALAYAGKPLGIQDYVLQKSKDDEKKSVGLIDNLTNKVEQVKKIVKSSPEEAGDDKKVDEQETVDKKDVVKEDKKVEEKKDKAPVAVEVKAPAKIEKKEAGEIEAEKAIPVKKDNAVKETKTQHLSEELIKTKHEESAGKEAEKNGIIEKISTIPGKVADKVAGLFGKKEKVVKKENIEPKQETAAPILKKEVKTATDDIKSILSIHGVDVDDLSFSSDGQVIYITFTSINIGTSNLVDELKAIFTSVDERIEQTGIISLKVISIKLRDKEKRDVALWEVDYKNYISYRDNKINGTQFRNSWKEIIK